MNRKKYLTFDLLEDVMFLPPDRYEGIVGQATVARIGPLVEYAYHHYEGATAQLNALFDDQMSGALAREFQRANLSQASNNTSIKARPLEFFRPPQSLEEYENPNWFPFCERLKDAGVKAGLSKQFSQALVGTFEEMTGNLLDHSERPRSGIVGYRWVPGEFEYVVADAGIGVLNSLRQHPDYSWLADSGEALETAISNGESRFGRRKLHGTGFNGLMFNIAQRNSFLRFRSGDHSHSIDGTRPVTLKKTNHCAHFNGFLISVICRPLKKELIKEA
jgi:hypothetical protein